MTACGRLRSVWLWCAPGCASRGSPAFGIKSLERRRRRRHAQGQGLMSSATPCRKKSATLRAGKATFPLLPPDRKLALQDDFPSRHRGVTTIRQLSSHCAAYRCRSQMQRC